MNDYNNLVSHFASAFIRKSLIGMLQISLPHVPLLCKGVVCPYSLKGHLVSIVIGIYIIKHDI